MRASVSSQARGYFRSGFPWSQACLNAFLRCLSSSYCSVVKPKLCFLESGPFPTLRVEMRVSILCSFLHLATKNGDVWRKQYRETFHISETHTKHFWQHGVGIWHRLLLISSRLPCLQQQVAPTSIMSGVFVGPEKEGLIRD